MANLKEIVLKDTRRFIHISNEYNPEHRYVLCFVPSFLVNIYHKSEKLSRILVEKNPKWYSNFLDRENDQMFAVDSWINSYKRKRKVALEFADFYEESYAKRDVSMQFHTFTQAEQSKMPFKDMVNLLKKTYENNGYPVLGYFWVAECSKNFHWHYHLALCTKRINLRGKGLPKWMKLTKQWGRRHNVVFVQKSIRNYLSKYFSKSNPYRLVGIRSIGKSSTYLLEDSTTHSL